MTKSERVRYEMFLRIRDFGTTHGDRFPESSRGGRMFAQVAQAAAHIEAQEKARLQARHDGQKGKAAARAAVVEWMRDIARTSRDIARTGGDSIAALQVPWGKSNVNLLTTARLFLDVARPISAELIDLGLDVNWEMAFKDAIEAFDARLNDRRAGRQGVATAHAAVTAALADGFDAIRTLDVIVANSLQDDPVLMPAWLRGRRIVDGKAKNDVAIESPAETADALKLAS